MVRGLALLAGHLRTLCTHRNRSIDTVGIL
jgi:hypothetical protein